MKKPFKIVHLNQTSPACVYFAAATVRYSNGVKPMDILMLGLCIFFVIHLLPGFTSIHATLKKRPGEKAFKITFALYCLISFKVKTSIRMITAHPLLWGISAWATGHLLANGDKASVLLFGSFLIYSLFAMFSANRRGARPTGDALALSTDAIVLAAALFVAFTLIAYHEGIAGVPLIG